MRPPRVLLALAAGAALFLTRPPAVATRAEGGGIQGSPAEYGPWNRDLLFSESVDGLRFSPAGTFEERGGVPS
ncbi:MAG: hypothetical protein FJY80_09650, partial [Candidatus Aminicenantes bacterium]|nr:hypothetical protein [Candidatus Aminicenantes bacterium]